jgi:hypothetical protein
MNSMMRRSVDLSPRFEPARRVGDDREKRDDGADHDLGRNAEAKPDREQRNDGDNRNGVRHDHVGKHTALKKPRMHDPGRQRNAKNRGDQEPGQRLQHGVSGVIPQRRRLEEAIDNIGRSRQQPRRNVKRLDGELPSGERAGKNEDGW